MQRRAVAIAMRRAWSRKGAAAAACLVAALLPLAPAVALPTNSTILETTYNIVSLSGHIS